MLLHSSFTKWIACHEDVQDFMQLKECPEVLSACSKTRRTKHYHDTLFAYGAT